MKHKEYKITKLRSKNDLPFDLLLLADETIEAIEKYIYECEVYVARERTGSLPVAVFALYKISDTEVEIKNMAVIETLQGQGLGSHLINAIKRIAILNKWQSIIVGTPSCSLRQIHFYEKNGFSKYGIRKDFFLTNYSQPIIENGITLNDMVMLKLKL